MEVLWSVCVCRHLEAGCLYYVIYFFRETLTHTQTHTENDDRSNSIRSIRNNIHKRVLALPNDLGWIAMIS